MGKKKDKSIKLSMPKKKNLYGVDIVKLPIGRYVRALNSLERLPGILADELMPGCEDFSDLITKLLSADKETIRSVFYTALVKIPQEVSIFIADLINIPPEHLTNDLTPNELTEILIALWEVNDMSDFFMNVRRLMELTARDMTANTGCKDGSQ